MRVLLAQHFPLDEPDSGPLTAQWAASLLAAGHEVRVLVIDDRHRFGEPIPVDRVVCGTDPNADLTFGRPRLSAASPGTGPLFSELSTAELSLYRDRLRRRIDQVLLGFDPQIVHVQHVWVLGQLILETGAPYVMNAWGPEFAAAQADARYRDLAELAAENASRVLAIDDEARRLTVELAESASERTALMPAELDLRGPAPSPAERQRAAETLEQIYRAVLEERYG